VVPHLWLSPVLHTGARTRAHTPCCSFLRLRHCGSKLTHSWTAFTWFGALHIHSCPFRPTLLREPLHPTAPGYLVGSAMYRTSASSSASWFPTPLFCFFNRPRPHTTWLHPPPPGGPFQDWSCPGPLRRHYISRVPTPAPYTPPLPGSHRTFCP